MELIRRQYPVGTRIILNHMDDSQAPPPGTKGTVAYVDDIGQIGVKWDTGSSLSLIPGVDSFSKEPAPEKSKNTNAPAAWNDERRMLTELRKRSCRPDRPIYP